MVLSLDELLEDKNASKLRARIQLVASIYSTKLALNLLDALKRPFNRIAEDVRIDHGECRRELTFDWRLPTLAEAIPDMKDLDDPRFLAKYAEHCPELAAPILPTRKEDLIHGFSVTGPKGEQLYECGRAESVRHTQIMLRTLWGWIDESAAGSIGHDPESLARAYQNFHKLPVEKPAKAREMAASVMADLASSEVQMRPGLSDRVSMMGLYMATHHIIWIHLPYQPGRSMRLTLTFRTRFAAGYSPRRGGANGLGRYHPFQRFVDCARRIVGQEPYRFSIPVWMSAYTRSYHFTMPAPPAMYFASQRFALAKNLHQSKPEQEAAFREYYQVNGAYVSGTEEAGGPVAHLYARDLPVRADNQLYAYARIRELPPGSTALVMWLCLLTAGFLWFYYTMWHWLIMSDSQGIDLPALSAALLGVAAIWFSHAFRDDIRPRVPLVSRFGLMVVGLSMLYSLLAILVQRTTCAPGGASSAKPVACPSAPLTDIFSHQGLFVVAVLVTVVGVWLARRRVGFHWEYQRLQDAAIDRYMS